MLAYTNSMRNERIDGAIWNKCHSVEYSDKDIFLNNRLIETRHTKDSWDNWLLLCLNRKNVCLLLAQYARGHVLSWVFCNFVLVTVYSSELCTNVTIANRNVREELNRWLLLKHFPVCLLLFAAAHYSLDSTLYYWKHYFV